MANEIKEGLDSSQETLKEEPKVEQITAEERAELEELRRVKELSSRDLKGKDTKITELTKQIMLTKTAEEQAKIEAENKHKSTLAKYSKLAVKAVGLEDEFSELISGNDEDEIDLKIQSFVKIKESISKEKDKTIKALEDRIKILEANGTPPPSGSPTVTATLQTQFNEAKKLNDLPMQMAIKRQAQREGFVINE